MRGKRRGSVTRGAVPRIAGLALAAAVLGGGPGTGVRAQALAPSRSLVDTPTAGNVPSGTFETRARVFPGGGLELRLDIGLTRWLTLGGGFGGVKVIGDGEPDWYPEPGFALKVRLLEETWTLPAFALGIDTQGAGYWDESLERFQFKSRGVYAVLSKNYAWLGDLTLHGGVGRSLEENDDRDVTPFCGIEKSIGSAWGMALEYDAAINDNRDDGAFGRGRGYLNGSLRWALSPAIELRFVVRDMLENTETIDPLYRDVIADEGWGRELSFSYMESF